MATATGWPEIRDGGGWIWYRGVKVKAKVIGEIREKNWRIYGRRKGTFLLQL